MLVPWLPVVVPVGNVSGLSAMFPFTTLLRLIVVKVWAATGADRTKAVVKATATVRWMNFIAMPILI